MHKRDLRFAGILLFIFFTWGAIAWYWYACSIKNLCTQNPNTFIPISSGVHPAAVHYAVQYPPQPQYYYAPQPQYVPQQTQYYTYYAQPYEQQYYTYAPSEPVYTQDSSAYDYAYTPHYVQYAPTSYDTYSYDEWAIKE